MTAQDKAKELVKKYEDYVCGYIGSSMLTNTEYPEQILKHAKECAIIAIEEILKELESIDDGQTSIPYEYWEQVKNEIEKL